MTCEMSLNNVGFSELTLNEMLSVEGGGFWAGVVAGLATVGTVGLAVAAAPATGETSLVAGYWVVTGIVTTGGVVGTIAAFKS